MNYSEQLLSVNWKSKRTEILQRDTWCCQNCMNKRLFSKYRISLHQIGLYANGTVIFVVYDKLQKNKLRCQTSYQKDFLNELEKLKNGNSLIALSIGTGDFVQLVATIILNENLDVSELPADITQKKQEDYLNFLHEEDLRKLRWIDTKGLHIHHQYYQQDLLAWEYSNEALITLCWSCHEDIHKDSIIPIYDSSGNLLDEKLVCGRCHGAGVFPEYNHVENGICFKCNGSRFES